MRTEGKWGLTKFTILQSINHQIENMKTENEVITIGVSKKKGLILTIFAFGFFVVLVWGFLKVETLPYTFNRTFVIICISLLIITSCLCFFSGLAKLTDKTQGLIISNDGLKINFGPNRGDFIQWDEITGLKIHNPVRGTMFLLIFIKNPEGILAKRKGLNRILLKMNNISHKTPVSLTSDWLDCSFDELVTMIEGKYKRYGAQHKI